MPASSAKMRPSGPAKALVEVRKGDGGWRVTSTATGVCVFSTKAEAVSKAQKSVGRSGGKVVVKATNGRVKEMLTLGSLAAVRMNAVEGVALNQASRRLVKNLSVKALTSAQQRAEILKAFKKARP